MRLYLGTWVFYTSAVVLRQVLPVTKSTLRAQEGFSDVWLGLFDTFFLTSYALGSFFSGWIGDRFAPGFLLVTSAVGSLVCCATLGSVSSVTSFAILFVLFGAFQSTAWPACLSLLGTKPSGLALGLWSTHGSVGGVIGKLVGAGILVSSGWGAVFTDLGVLGGGVGLLASYYLHYHYIPRTTPVVTVAAPTPSFWSVCRHTPHLLAFSACFFFVKLTVYCLLGWLPTYLTTLGYSASSATLLATVYDVASVIGGIAAGYWMDRVGQPATICLQTLLAAALFLLLYLTYGAVHVVLQVGLLFAVGLTLNVPYILISGKISTDLGEKHPVSRSTIAGILNGCGGLGAAAQGVIVGVLGDSVSWSWLLGLITMCTVASALCLWGLVREEHVIVTNKSKAFTVTGKHRNFTTIVIPPGTTTVTASGVGLTSLEGCPDGLISLDVSYNRLTSLRHLPTSVQNLRASRNLITTLTDLTSHAELRSLGISCNHLTSLKGCPSSVRSMVCTNNFLRSWEGFPPVMDKLYASYNQIPNLFGAPAVKNFDCSCNLITSLVGCPEGVTEFNCCNNLLVSLEGCPTTVELLRCSSNQLTTLDRDWGFAMRLVEATKNPLSPVDYSLPSFITEVYM